MGSWRLAGERGSTTLELTILAPFLLLFISVVVFAGRMAIANQSVESAAWEAARQASISRSSSYAHTSARDAAKDSLQQQGLECGDMTVAVDVDDFSRAPGRGGEVSATVACRVRLSDLMIPGVPGSRLVEASASSPLDTYRERG